MALSLASAKLFYSRGARYATATTNSSAHYLRKLYLKITGELAGQTVVDGIDTALFVFDLERLLNHRVMRRVSPYFAFERDVELALA